MAELKQTASDFMDWLLKGDQDAPPADPEPIFASRRGAAAAADLRDQDAMAKVISGLNADRATAGLGPRVDAPPQAGLADPANISGPPSSPGPTVAAAEAAGLSEPRGWSGGNVDLKTGPVNSNMWREDYRVRDILIPPLTINRAFRNATGAPLREAFPELGRFAYYTGWAGNPRYEMAVRGYKALDDALAAQKDQGLITNRINNEHEPKIAAAQKAATEANNGRDTDKITEAAKALAAANKAKDDALAAVTANNPDGLRNKIGKQLDSDLSMRGKKFKGGVGTAAKIVGTLATTVAGTLAAKAILDANAKSDTSDTMLRFARGDPITRDDEELVRSEMEPDQFAALNRARAAALGRPVHDQDPPTEEEGSWLGSMFGSDTPDPAAPAATEPPPPAADAGGMNWGDITDRYVSGRDVTPEEMAAITQYMQPDTLAELTKYRDQAGGPPVLLPGQEEPGWFDGWFGSGGEPSPPPPVVEPSPPLNKGAAPVPDRPLTQAQRLQEQGYEVPDYARPEVAAPTSTIQAEDIVAAAQGDPDAQANLAAAQTELGLDRTRNFVDAGIQNFGSALGLPESMQAGLANAAEGARSGQVADVIPDNFATDAWDFYSNLWSDYIMKPYRGWKAADDPYDPSFFHNPANWGAWAAKKVLPEDAYKGFIDYGFGDLMDPMNYYNAILGTTSDEAGQYGYNFAREALTALEATGVNQDKFAPAYRKILGDLGGVPLGYDNEALTAVRPEGPPGGMPAAPPMLPQGMVRPEFGMGGMPAAPEFMPQNMVRPEMDPGGMPGMPPLAKLPPPDLGPAGVVNDMPPTTSPDMMAVPPPAPVAVEDPSAGGFFSDIGGAISDWAGLGQDGQADREAEAQKARETATAAISGADETHNPPGQFETSPIPKSRPAGLNEPAATAPEPASPEIATGAPTTTGTSAAPGAVGDFTGSKGSTQASLADDAADAEKELNWINRQMRDKMGMDASQRAKAAEALISGGAAMLASKGDSWQSLGEGLQAGLGSVTAANDEEAASLAAAQSAMADESRWQQEMALKRLQAGGSEPGAMPKKLEEVMNTMSWMKLMYPDMSEADLKAMAENYSGVKSQAAWGADPNAWMDKFAVAGS